MNANQINNGQKNAGQNDEGLIKQILELREMGLLFKEIDERLNLDRDSNHRSYIIHKNYMNRNKRLLKKQSKEDQTIEDLLKNVKSNYE